LWVILKIDIYLVIYSRICIFKMSCTLYHNTVSMIQHVPANAGTPERPERIVGIEGILKGHTYQQSLYFLSVVHHRGRAILREIPTKSDSVWARCESVKVEDPLSRESMIAEYGAKQVQLWENILADEGDPATEEGDNYWSAGTLLAARFAAQAAIRAAQDILAGTTTRAFCIVRPPGHHCFQTPAGFCVLNNAVLATKEFLKAGKRVAIVDWDYHFGDGTAKAFLEEERVAFVSIHAAKTQSGWPTYPPACKQNLKGAGLSQRTKGRMWNVQWTLDDADDAAFQYAFEANIVPKLQTWGPDVILISAGYDAVKGDDLAGMQISPHAFRRSTQSLVALGKPVLAILEGGYNPALLGECVKETVQGFLNDPCEPVNSSVQECHANIVKSAY
jgi:acetoin utilization deacetylase AcuC-like enzyme